MPKTESFDITTGVDLQEVDNAVNQAKKEIGNRFDFKNVVAEIEFDRHAPKLTIHTQDEYTLESMWQVMQQRFNSRHVPLQNMTRGNVEKASGSTVRQEVKITQSIDTLIWDPTGGTSIERCARTSSKHSWRARNCTSSSCSSSRISCSTR